MDKKKFLREAIYKALGMYAFLTFFILILSSIFNSNIVGLSLDKMGIILGFSVLFGLSFAIFGMNTTATTKRTLHVIATLVLWVCAFLLLGNTSEGKSFLILGAIIACLIFMVAYPTLWLLAKLWKKIMF